jgi:CelD/BcsL family acetyltransferase involved in cellulose biosynthesis
MQTGFDPDHSEAGQVLLTYMVESAIGEGHGVLDFLRGEHAYKEQFTSSKRETVLRTVLRSNPGAWVYRVRRLYLPKVKARVMRAVKNLGIMKSTTEK